MPKQFEGGLPSAGEIKKHRLKLLVVIADRAKIRLVTDVLQERRLHLHFTCLAEGTAGSDILDLLGIGAVDKALSLCVAPSSLISRLMDRLNERLGLARPGKGIAFTLPLSGVSSPVLQLLDHESRENLQIAMENEVEKTNTTA